MRRAIRIFIFLFQCYSCNAQVSEGNWNISLNHKVPIQKTELMRSNLTGLELEYMVGDNVGFNYTMYGGNGVLHMPGGLLVGVLALCALGSVGGDVDEEILLYSFAIPEGVTYNIKLVDRLYFSPYVNPLGLELQQYQDEEFNWFLMGSTGVKMKAFIHHSFYFYGFAEAQLEYTHNQKLGGRTGISLGVSF